MPTILLVEDDINLREIYAARLGAEDYRVVVASDGEEALAKAVQEKPDVILLDVMMPKISGFDVLDIIRSTPETRGIKVIMLTALSQSTDRERGEKLGVDKYLVKSQITLEDVVENVKSLLPNVDTDKQAPNKDEGTTKKSEDDEITETLKNLKIEVRPMLNQEEANDNLKKSPSGDNNAAV